MHTDRFTERARAYAATRPKHPPATIDYVLDGFGDRGAINLADLGSGTGLSSLPFAEAGANVWAIEPNDAMRDAAEPHPRIISVNATAEHTTLDDAIDRHRDGVYGLALVRSPHRGEGSEAHP